MCELMSMKKLEAVFNDLKFKLSIKYNKHKLTFLIESS